MTFKHDLPVTAIYISGDDHADRVRRPSPMRCLFAIYDFRGQNPCPKRLDLGLLQKEAADQLGVDTASICNWESNTIQPMVHCLPGIIAFLGHNPLPEAGDLIGKFKRLRISLGLTQEQLAQKLGIDESTIAHWEKGINRPTGAYRDLVERFVGGNGSLDCAVQVAQDPFSPERLARARKRLGLSLGELARTFGVDRNTLSRWERGDRHPHGLHRTMVQNIIRLAAKSRT